MPDIIIGKNHVFEALRAGRAINKILIEKNTSRSSIENILFLCRENKVPIEFVGKDAINRISPSGRNQNIIAIAAVKDYVKLEDILSLPKSKNEPPFFVVLDGIEDPQNLGAILRSAEATGVHGVIIRERRAVGLTEAVGLSSAGAVEYVPVARVSNIAQTLDTLKSRHEMAVWITGIDMQGDKDFRDVDYTGGTVLVIGGEGTGISRLVRAKCDILARIPMKGKITSLNASVAAALVMYEVMRQRDKHI